MNEEPNIYVKIDRKVLFHHFIWSIEIGMSPFGMNFLSIFYELRHIFYSGDGQKKSLWPE